MTTSKKRCPFCRKSLPTGEMKKFGIQYFCSLDHAVQYANKPSTKEKGRKIERKYNRDRKRELDRDSIQWQLKQTQIAFNKMRVLEEMVWFKNNGKEPECISCGKTNMDWCCGHFKTRGSQSNLRFDRRNTFLQCNRYCNQALSGNIYGNKTTRGYIQGLHDRFGDKEAKAIIEYCETNTTPIKWTREMLESMRAEFNKRARELKAEL